MRYIDREQKIFANEEWWTCENCGDDFVRRTKIKHGKMRPGIRRVGCETCSKQCSREMKKWKYMTEGGGR